MMSLFSSFDLNFSYMLFSFIGASILLKWNFKIQTFMNFVLQEVFAVFCSYFTSLKPSNFSKYMFFLLTLIFMFVTILNVSSVFSFIFPSNSQMSVVLFFSFSFWSSLIVFTLVHNYQGLVSHLVPSGCPMPLVSFLFLVEFVSNLIRPITLTVRLVANIVAGHLLMTLLSQLIFSYPLGFFSYVGLNMVEIFVGAVQAYIITTMCCLYFSEME